MEDLIYKFLIQSGYSRASIVTDIQSIDEHTDPGDASFVIVDPETIDRLAVLKVIGPVKAEALIDQSSLVARLTHSIGGEQAQGFVVRVDAKAKRDPEQVQFYRCYPNTALQPITARTFPDLDSMRVNFKLKAPSLTVKPLSVATSDDADWDEPIPGNGAFLPAFVLIIVALIDWVVKTVFGVGLLQPSQSLLLVGAALLLSAPALFRFKMELDKS